MNFEVSYKARCMASMLFLVAVFLLVAAAIAWPLWENNKLYEERAMDSAERIGRYQSLIEQRTAMEDALKQLRLEQKKRGYFLDSSNPDLAAAKIQEQVKAIVTGAGGTLVSTQNVSPARNVDLGRVEVKVRMKGDAEAVAKVLHGIESRRPLMFIDKLNIRSRKTVKGRRNNRVTTYSLDVNFDLSSYMLGGS